jgi:transcriptional regulator with XRE-family HTH domain
MEAAAGARIREQRKALGMSLRQLGQQVGVSASMLSQVENGRCQASVATLYKLVNELGISFDDLFDPPTGPSSSPSPAAVPAPTSGGPSIVRSDAAHRPDSPVQSPPDRVRIELESGITWERLSHFSPAGLEFILVTYRPGSSSGQSGKYQQHEGFETAYIESGELTFHHKFDTWTLRAGDTVTFDASEPHRLENLGTEDVRAVWLILRGAPAHAEPQAAPHEPGSARGGAATLGVIGGP